MTVHVLMEPLYSCLSVAYASSKVAGSGSLADLRWSVTLVGWRNEGRKWLPETMEVQQDGQLNAEMSQVSGSQVSGILSRERLDGWIRDLQRDGESALAQSLSQTLQAHLAADPVLGWGRWNLDLSRPRVMGIINVTPDSFSGDGLHRRVEAAVAQGVRMAAEGADILDVGGESSRPGASTVSSHEEMDRVIPVVEALAKAVDLPISVDTRRSAVMRASLEAGAAIINDITALSQGGGHRQDGAAYGDRSARDDATVLLAEWDVPVVLMHMQGRPATMQERPTYRHVCAEVYAFLAERLRDCVASGIARSRLIVDPGIGFGKTHSHNLHLLRHLSVFRGLGVPILLGVSRKRLVGAMSGEQQVEKRDVASHMLAVLAALSGARIVRVHDVAGAVQALSVAHVWSYGLESAS